MIDNNDNNMAVSLLPQIICYEVFSIVNPPLFVITLILSFSVRDEFAIITILVGSVFVIIDRLAMKPLVGMMIMLMLDAAIVDRDNIDYVNSGMNFGKSLTSLISSIALLFAAIFVAMTVSALTLGDAHDTPGIGEELIKKNRHRR